MTTLVTHPGRFHADDVVAFAVLSRVFPDADLVRTRDPARVAAADVVFDVGGEFDPERHRYDHHQRGGAGERADGVPFAAAGLVWRRFGGDFCRPHADRCGVAPGELAAAVDRALIRGVDATDCGRLETGPRALRGRPGTTVLVPSISSLVAGFNPRPLVEDETPAVYDAAFRAAAACVSVLVDRIVLGESSRLKSRAVVRAADEGGPVLVLPVYWHWAEVVLGELPHVRLVLFPKPEGTWVCHTVSTGPGSDEARTPLPDGWRGLSGPALRAITGVDDALFCHGNGFLCTAGTRAGAEQLAALALRGTNDALGPRA